ncbi:MAG: hypothetical protein FJ029_15205 [Actinobacteria bacterium]|nr:hypothetical protein [Actinomycetota bacterium]
MAGGAGAASGLLSFTAVVAPGLVGLVQGYVADAYGLRATAILAAVAIGLAVGGAACWLPSVPAAVAGSHHNAWLAYGRVMRDRPVQALMLVRAASSVAFGVFALLAGPRLVAASGGLTAVGQLVLIGSLGGAAAQIGIGRLSDAIGRRGVLLLVTVLGAGAPVLFGMATGVPTLLLISAAFYLSAWASQTLVVALGGDLARPGTVDQVMSLDSSVFSWGVVVAAILVLAFGASNPAAAFVLGGAANVLGIVALPFARRPATVRGRETAAMVDP